MFSLTRILHERAALRSYRHPRDSAGDGSPDDDGSWFVGAFDETDGILRPLARILGGYSRPQGSSEMRDKRCSRTFEMLY